MEFNGSMFPGVRKIKLLLFFKKIRMCLEISIRMPKFVLIILLLFMWVSESLFIINNFLPIYNASFCLLAMESFRSSIEYSILFYISYYFPTSSISTFCAIKKPETSDNQ